MLEIHAQLNGKWYNVVPKPQCEQVVERARVALLEWHAHYPRAKFEVCVQQEHECVGYFGDFFDAYNGV